MQQLRFSHFIAINVLLLIHGQFKKRKIQNVNIFYVFFFFVILFYNLKLKERRVPEAIKQIVK